MARTRNDGSGCCFNYCCVPSCAIRNVIRVEYGIGGSACGDIAYSTCCPCCSAAQVYNEVDAQQQNTVAPSGAEMR